MDQSLIAVTSIVVLGILAQWLAWRLHFPSILLLLAFGYLAGAGTGVLDPDLLFGDLLFPVVSLCVAVILFEGGLSLRFAELAETGGVVRNLVSLGALVTWLSGAAAAHWVLGLDRALSALLGAILVVTGPTVIGPLLRQVRPSGKVGPILKWEGIVIDPIGAALALLVFEAVFADTARSATELVVFGVLRALVVGGVLGAAGAGLLVLLLRRYWIPDFLQSPAALMLTIAAFAGANSLQDESGLLAVTIMGILLANQKLVSIKHIVEFKENLGVLLISGLFILLAARLDPADFSRIGWSGLLFVAALIFVVRPLSVLVSSIGSGLALRERIFLALVAPRGIVAAAVSSVFALRLTAAGHAGAELLVPLTFLAIICTVVFYGLSAPLVARWLGLSKSNPQGVLFVGAHSWAREVAAVLKENGYSVLLIDANSENVEAARLEGLPAHLGNILSEELKDDINIDGIGRLLAVTPNDEVNSLSVLHFIDVFGRAEVYQLVTSEEAETRRESTPRYLRGRSLFSRDATCRFFEQRFRGAAALRSTPLTEQFDFDAFRAQHGATALPLFLIKESRELTIFTVTDPPAPKPGQTVISLVDREMDSADDGAASQNSGDRETRTA